MSPYDRLAPMRLYTLSKRHFVLVFLLFLICFALTVFIGIAGMAAKSFYNIGPSWALFRNNFSIDCRYIDTAKVSKSE